MKVAATSILALILLSLPHAASHAQAAPGSLTSAIDAVVQKDRIVYGGRTPLPSLLVGVWGNGFNYVRAYGYADLASRRPLTSADHYRIGSNTKTFVISVLLQLVDEGKLRLDDPLSRFNLGVSIPNAKNITVREVCQMRSGLFEAYNTPEVQRISATATGNTKFDARTLIRWAVKQKPYFAAGTRYNYSNTNYLILGQLIESITKHSVGDEIRRRLLVPFQLTHTSYPRTQVMPDPWAHGYSLDSGGRWRDISNTIPVSLMGSAGEMISDMADMKRWVKLYVTGKTNGAATQRERLQCLPTGEGNVSYGLGIGCSAGWYGYTGGLPGYNTATYYFPAKGLTVIAWVPLQRDTFPDTASAVFRDIARVITPGNVPYAK